jgi:MFS family permease
LEVSHREAIKVTVAAVLGTLIEFYDLFISGIAAAIAWPQLFFPQSNAAVAAAASMSAFAVAFLARPLGAFIFGHVGDRVGRKTTMIWTLTLMGVGLLGVALTPTYATIGVLAPALVIVFRILQGIGVGGEYGGAASWIAEVVAKSKWRTAWTSFVQADAVGGFLLAFLAFTVAGYYMSNADLVSYGWRIIFIVGAVGIVIAGVIRVQLSESPLFQALKQRRAVAKVPSIEVLRRNWKRLLLLAVVTVPTNGVGNIVISPFSVQYLAALKMETVSVTMYVTIASIISVAVHIVGGVLASITGKKRLLLVLANLWYIIWIIPYFYLLGTKSLPLIFIAVTLLYAVPRPGAACIPAVLTESFETKYRISGSGLAYQIGSFIVGVIISFVVPAFIAFGGGPIGAVPYVAASYLIASVAAMMVAAFYVKDISELPA